MPLRDEVRDVSLVEDAIISMRDQMRAQLNAQLDIVYAAAGDATINLEHVPDSRYYISEAIEPLQPPAIFLVADSSEFLLEFQQGSAQKHSILVAAVFDDIEIQRLTRKAWRYARAIYNTLHDQAVGEIHVLCKSVDYGPTIVKGAVGSRTFRKDVTVRCEVLHFER